MSKALLTNSTVRQEPKPDIRLIRSILDTDPRANAFNKHDNSTYWYKYDDMQRIGEVLFFSSNSIDRSQVVLAAPLGIDAVERHRVDISEQLKKFEQDLQHGKRVVGTYTIGESGGGSHWIAYIIFKNALGQIKCIYKDSLGQTRPEFEQQFKSVFYPLLDDKFLYLHISPTDNLIEQQDGSSCGIFALENAMKLASIQLVDLISRNLPPFFSPNYEERGQSVEILSKRKAFAQKYVLMTLKEKCNDVLKKLISDHHEEEANILSALLQTKVSIHTDSNNPNNPHGYLYNIILTEEQSTIIESIVRQYIFVPFEQLAKTIYTNSKEIHLKLLPGYLNTDTHPSLALLKEKIEEKNKSFLEEREKLYSDQVTKEVILADTIQELEITNQTIELELFQEAIAIHPDLGGIDVSSIFTNVLLEFFDQLPEEQKLKIGFATSVDSLARQDKEELVNLIKTLDKTKVINIFDKVKDFIKDHQNAFQIVLDLFKIDGEDWTFDSNHISTLINIINDWGRKNIPGFSNRQPIKSKDTSGTAQGNQQNDFNKLTSQQQENLVKVTTSCKEQIITEINNILKIVEKGNIDIQDIHAIEESLFRVSWRSSEIPVQLRFSTTAPYSALTEKTWVRLDYLSNSLIQIQDKDNIKLELFENIRDDLNKLKEALLIDKVSNKENQINLPSMEKFISFFYDKYLLEQIADHLRKITDARNGELFLEFLEDEQVCYGTFRALEVLGESFKNLSNNILGLFTEDVRTGFRELRNVIHHNRPKLELIMRHNKDILKDILEESCKMLVPINSILEKIENSNLDNYSSLESIVGDLVSNTVKVNINLDSIKDLIKILNTKTILSKEEKAKLFDHVEEQDKSILEKIIFRLDKKTIDPIESKEEIDEIIKNLKGKYDIEFTKYIREIIWKAYHKIPFEDYESIKNKILESKDSFKVQDFKNKLVARMEHPDKESGKQIITYNEILNSIKKMKFSSSQDEDHLKKLITAYVMDDEKYKDFIKDVSSIDEIIGDSEKKSLNQIFEQLDLLKQEMSDQVSIIKKFYYKKFLNDRKSEVLSFIDKILPVPFDINQFKKIDDYEEKLKNLSKISKTFEKDGNLNVAENFLALSNAYGSSKYKESLKIKFTKKIEELRKEQNYVNYFNVLDTKKTISEIMEYINPIIDEAPKKQRKNLEDIRTFYLNNFLQSNRSEVENFIQTIIDENIKESSIIDIQTFKEELKIWIDTGKLKSASFNEILIDLEKINFSHSEDKENLRYFLDTLIMDNDEYEDLIRKIDKFKTEKRLENIFNLLELQDSLEALPKKFKILEKNNFDQMDKIEKVLLRDFIDKQSSEVTNFINNIVLQHPADIFDEIITSETLVDSNLQLLGQKLLFDHTKEYNYNKEGSEEREKDFNKTDEELKVFFRVFYYLKQSQIELRQNESSKLDDEEVDLEVSSDYSRKITKILTKIEKLENTLLDLNSPSLLAKDKSIMKLSAQYLLEDIGSASNGFIKSQDFQDYGYVSISKRQFLILNIARKAMAHHPMYIDDEKLEFYIKQLVLDSQFRLQQLENKTLENNNVTIFSNEFIDFSTRRDVSFEELETKKELIKSIIFGNGFLDQVIIFNKKMGCDIGIQGDAVFIVFPIEGRANFICELELELSYNLNCDIKVYTPYTLTQEFLNKLTIEHQTEVLAVEQFDDFLTTKKFEQIYDDGTWTKARILGIGDVYKNQPISKKDFAAATEVEYVFNQRYKNEQREKTKQFRQDRIDKVKGIEDIIIYKTSIYAQKICKVLNEIKGEIGLASLHRLFNILMLDRLLIQEVGEYFIKHEYQIQTKFPELSTITKNGFINYAYDKPEEFFIKFPTLSALKELIIDKKNAFESLNTIMKKGFYTLGLIVSQLRGTEIVEHIAKNIVHFVVKDNNWLLMPAILTNLKEKYCNDSNILKIWLNKNLVKINNSLQQYGYLFGGKNIQIPEDFILLEFSGEVEYTYLQRKKALTNQLQFEKVEIISQIFSEDLSILETLENTHPDSTGYNYRIPHISNGILGFSSELDQELMHINEQISGGNIGRKPLIPNLFIEDFIDRINELLQQNNIIAIIPRIDTTCRFTTKVNTLKDLLEFHGTPRSIFEEDTKKIADYYEFRHLNDKLNTILCRVNKYIQKAKNLQELISKNPNGYTIQLQQQNLKKIIDIFQQDYEIHNQLVEEIFNSSYVKERIIKILQNPFELQKILTFVQSAPQEDQGNLLKNIISNAISTIKVAIKQEFQVNANLSKEATTILTDTYEFDNYLATLQKSLVISDQNTQEGKVEKDKHEGYIFIEGKTIPCLFVETTNIDSDYKEVLIGENSFSYGTIGYFGID